MLLSFLEDDFLLVDKPRGNAASSVCSKTDDPFISLCCLSGAEYELPNMPLKRQIPCRVSFLALTA
jgi:hypothetical protein